MALIDWSTEYSVNIREIDRQHEKLFGMLNELYDAMSKGKGKSVMGPVLSHLIEYTDYHFATEERLFALHEYPGAAEHTRQHRALTAEAKAFKQRFEANEVLVTSELLGFLKSWLSHHISGTDRQYSAYLNARGVR